jgi:hypothetical protein
MYRVGGKILGAIKSMYEQSMVCGRIGLKLWIKFNVDAGLRQECVMSPWLFSILIDGAVREVDARVMARGAALLSNSGGEWQVNQYAYDTALIADKECKLQKLVSEFGRVCERRKLSVNVAKSKVMMLT